MIKQKNRKPVSGSSASSVRPTLYKFLLYTAARVAQMSFRTNPKRLNLFNPAPTSVVASSEFACHSSHKADKDCPVF
jgi:hypothetical protein